MPFWKDLKLQNSHNRYVAQPELHLEKTVLALHGDYQTWSLPAHSHGLSGLMGSWLNTLSEQVTWGSALKAAHPLAESPLVSIKIPYLAKHHKIIHRVDSQWLGHGFHFSMLMLCKHGWETIHSSQALPALHSLLLLVHITIHKPHTVIAGSPQLTAAGLRHTGSPGRPGLFVMLPSVLWPEAFPVVATDSPSANPGKANAKDGFRFSSQSRCSRRVSGHLPLWWLF